MSDINDTIQVAELKKDVYYLTRMMTDYIQRQDKVNEKQQDILDKLDGYADRGKGSIWILISIGSIITVILSNIPIIKKLFE